MDAPLWLIVFAASLVPLTLTLVVAVVGVTLRRLRPAQRLVVCLGAWAMAAEALYPPYVEVVATVPLIDIDPPNIPRYPREKPAGRSWVPVSEVAYSPHLLGTHRDVRRLGVELLATALVTLAAASAIPCRQSARETPDDFPTIN